MQAFLSVSTTSESENFILWCNDVEYILAFSHCVWLYIYGFSSNSMLLMYILLYRIRLEFIDLIACLIRHQFFVVNFSQLCFYRGRSFISYRHAALWSSVSFSNFKFVWNFALWLSQHIHLSEWKSSIYFYVAHDCLTKKKAYSLRACILSFIRKNEESRKLFTNLSKQAHVCACCLFVHASSFIACTLLCFGFMYKRIIFKVVI